MFKIIRWIIALVLIIGIYFIATIYWYGYKNYDLQKSDAAVVMGAAQYNGQPSPIFSARLDRAKLIYDDKLVKKIVVTGGRGLSKDITSEGRSGRNYLVDHGVDASDIIFEENSHTTQENIFELKKILKDKKINSVIFVSDRFHMFRISQIANKEKINYQLSPTTSSPVENNKSEEFKFVLQELQSYFSFVFLGV